MIALIIFTIFLLITAFLIHSLIIYPYLEVRRYQSYGFRAFFYPILGYAKFKDNSIVKHKDFAYETRRLNIDFPNARGLSTHFAGFPYLLLTDTSLKKEFHLNQNKYKKPDYLADTLRFYKGVENIVSAEDATWKKHRKIISTTFHFDFVTSRVPLIKDSTSLLFAEIKDHENVDIETLFHSITGTVITRVMFGANFSSLSYEGKSAALQMAHFIDERMIEALKPWLAIFGQKKWRRLSSKYNALLTESEDFIEKIVVKFVYDRFKEFELEHSGKDLKDFVGTSLLENMFRLILLKEEKYSVDEAISDCLVLFFAGTDTTGSFLTNLIWILDNHKSKFETLMKEINDFIKNDGDITFENVKKMDYLNAVLKEGLRFRSSAQGIFPREAKMDHYLKDVLIRKGTLVDLAYNANFHDPKVFKNPMEFLPERWLKDSPLYENAEENDPFIYTPFSAGGRNCIGQHMSLLEAKVILIMFLRNYRYELKNQEEMVWVLKLLVELEKPLMVALKPNA